MPERHYLLELFSFSRATRFSAFAMNFSRPLSIVKRFGLPFRAPIFRIFRNSIPSRRSGSWHAPRIELSTDSARHWRNHSAAISVTARAQKAAVVLLWRSAGSRDLAPSFRQYLAAIGRRRLKQVKRAYDALQRESMFEIPPRPISPGTLRPTMFRGKRCLMPILSQR